MQSQVDVVVFLNLVRFNNKTGRREVLLNLRRDTGLLDNGYCYACGGYLEALEGEDVLDAIRRMAFEDLGIEIARSDLMLAYIGQSVPKKQIFFIYQLKSLYEGAAVQNLKPEKCAELKWFDQESWPKGFVILEPLGLVQLYRHSACASEIS